MAIALLRNFVLLKDDVHCWRDRNGISTIALSGTVLKTEVILKMKEIIIIEQ